MVSWTDDDGLIVPVCVWGKNWGKAQSVHCLSANVSKTVHRSKCPCTIPYTRPRITISSRQTQQSSFFFFLPNSFSSTTHFLFFLSLDFRKSKFDIVSFCRSIALSKYCCHQSNCFCHKNSWLSKCHLCQRILAAATTHLYQSIVSVKPPSLSKYHLCRKYRLCQSILSPQGTHSPIVSFHRQSLHISQPSPKQSHPHTSFQAQRKHKPTRSKRESFSRYCTKSSPPSLTHTLYPPCLSRSKEIYVGRLYCTSEQSLPTMSHMPTKSPPVGSGPVRSRNLLQPPVPYRYRHFTPLVAPAPHSR